MDGLTKWIADRASDYERQIPVTIITYQADAESVKRTLDHGR